MEQKVSGKNSVSTTARQTVVYGTKSDGHLSVFFLDSDVEAYADFIPASMGGKPLEAGAMTAVLDKINVVYGVRWDNIRAALSECNINRQTVKDVLIAKGDEPEPEVAETYVLNPFLKKAAAPEITDSETKINYRERSPFVIVKQGQILARLKPRKPGREGKNVHGVVLPFATIQIEGVTGGENTRTDNGRILSAIHGQFIQNKNVISVQENLVIKGAVGYHTGNIAFPGDVQIDGPVSDGFKIYSGGSLVIKQTLDLTEVVTKGDIVVLGGIIGKGAALIKSGGGIKTKFIENCHVAARKSVLIDTEILNSSIYTLGNVEMGDRGVIVSSDIYAVHGLKAGTIGKKTGKATNIHCGIDFTVQQEKEKYTNQLRILSSKIARLRAMLSNPELQNPEKKTGMEELLQRLQEEQRAATTRISGLLENINTDANATVEVSGGIASGTLIEICQVPLIVEEPLYRVRIHLDKANKPVTEPL